MAAPRPLDNDDLEFTNSEKQITNLQEDISKLCGELRSKNELLDSLLDLAHQQRSMRHFYFTVKKTNISLGAAPASWPVYYIYE